MELAAAAGNNGKIYAIGGIDADGVPLAIVEEYDGDQWNAKNPMPTARFCLAAVTAQNGKIYAIGGLRSCAGVAIVEEFDPSLNHWEVKSPLRTDRWFLTVAANDDGKIYAIGGYRRESDSVILLDTVEVGTVSE